MEIESLPPSVQAGCERPGNRLWGVWSSAVILVITLIFGVVLAPLGILWGGILTASNWYHLGEPQRGWRPLLIAIGGSGLLWLLPRFGLTGIWITLCCIAGWLATGLLVYLDIWPQGRAVAKYRCVSRHLAKPWIPIGVAGAILTHAAAEWVYFGKDIIAEAAVERGIEYYDDGDFENAWQEFFRAFEIRPEEPSYHFLLAEALYAKGDSEWALKCYSSHLRLGGREPDAYVHRAAIFIDREDYGPAIADCNEAIRIDPMYEESYLQRGIAYACTADHSSAIRDFNRLIELNPRAPAGYRARAVVREQMGDIPGAREDDAIASQLEAASGE